MKNRTVKIEKILPFNDLFYKSCFYNSLFPILKFYNKNIDDLLFNDISIYMYDESQKNLVVSYRSEKSILELAEEMGIAANTKYVPADLISHCISVITAGKPIILWVDCYHLTYRQDTSGKQHLPHSLLLYGYDLAEECFLGMEQSRSDVLDYCERPISFKDVMTAHEAYVRNYQTVIEFPAYLDFHLAKPKQEIRNSDYYAKRTKKNVAENIEQIEAGINIVHNFLAELGNLFSHQMPKGAERHAYFVTTVNEIINGKKFLDFKYNRQSVFTEIWQVNTELVSLWSFLRAKLLFLTAGIPSRNSTEIYEKIDRINCLEQSVVNYWQRNIASKGGLK